MKTKKATEWIVIVDADGHICGREATVAEFYTVKRAKEEVRRMNKERWAFAPHRVVRVKEVRKQVKKAQPCKP